MKIRMLSLALIALLLTGCAQTENTLRSAGQAAANKVESAVNSAQATAAPEPAATQPSALLTQEEAEQIALDHAGVAAAEVWNLRTKYELDDGVPEYEVDFRSGDYDYDYTIHAETGAILSHDREYEPLSTSATAAAPTLTAEEAQKVALDHAGFTADQVTRLRSEYDEDRGIAHYDVEFNEGRYEYDYEIDAATGEILSFEKDD